MGVKTGKGFDGIGVVEFLIDSAAASQFKHVAARQRHDLRAPFHDLSLAARAGDQARHDCCFVPVSKSHTAVLPCQTSASARQQFAGKVKHRRIVFCAQAGLI